MTTPCKQFLVMRCSSDWFHMFQWIVNEWTRSIVHRESDSLFLIIVSQSQLWRGTSFSLIFLLHWSYRLHSVHDTPLRFCFCLMLSGVELPSICDTISNSKEGLSLSLPIYLKFCIFFMRVLKQPDLWERVCTDSPVLKNYVSLLPQICSMFIG
jgi:hypothetical protein